MTPRLLKVILQPVYVVETDDDLREVPVQPITLGASEWKSLNPEAWAKEGATAVEAQLDGQGPI